MIPCRFKGQKCVKIKLYITYRVVRNLAPEMKLERELERRASSGKRQRGMTGRGFRVCIFTNPVEATVPPCILAMPDIAFVSLFFLSISLSLATLCTTKPDLTKFLRHYIPAIKLEPHFMRFQNKNGNLRCESFRRETAETAAILEDLRRIGRRRERWWALRGSQGFGVWG